MDAHDPGTGGRSGRDQRQPSRARGAEALGDMSHPIASLEDAEVRSLADLFDSAPADLVEQCGAVVKMMGGSLLVATTRLDVLALNRVVGIGLGHRATRAEVASIVSGLDDIGSPRFLVQVAPIEGSEEIEAWLIDLGLRHHNNWVRLSRELSELPSDPSPSHLDVRLIGAEDAGVFGRIVAEAFGLPAPVATLLECPIGRPGWRHYIAYEGTVPIGAAAMFLAGESAWFGFAGTAAERRGRGAQTALVLRRLHDAAAAGCRWISVETAEQTQEREAPSFRNLRRLGFSVAYTRPNYLWTRRAT